MSGGMSASASLLALACAGEPTAPMTINGASTASASALPQAAVFT